MNYVLAGASISAVLARSQGAAAQWWQAAGVTPVAAYAPKGAASLAASYVNLANPGTYDCTVGVAPTFDTLTGWTFALASSTYLRTGILASATTTVIVKFSNAAANVGENAPLIGSGINATNNSFQIIPINTANSVAIFAFGSGANTSISKIISGVAALAGANIYINGSSVGTVSGTFSGTGIELFIGGHNNAGTPGRYANAKISSVWIANSVLSAAAVAAQSAVMP